MGTKTFVTVRVDGVIVIPMKDGYAYSHTADGRCVVLSGPRERMLELCMRVQHSQLTGGAHIYVNALDFSAYNFLTVRECPLHGHAVA